MSSGLIRIRDPVHGVIAWDESEPVDSLAWSLLNAPEFQRLRRIKQLGVSEFVFPGATHTRFSHCVGVFHTARQVIKVINRELSLKSTNPNPYREKVSIVAALVHDIGHGPFSHAFEHAYAAICKDRDPNAEPKSHENWTSEIILDKKTKIRELLDKHSEGKPLADDVARLLKAKQPEDIYHAVVSSSFDADRLDYLRRDRLMTGSGAGAIDFDWLMDNLVVHDIDPDLDIESSSGMRTPSLCLRERALQAAEAFILARWHLYCQVYLHKTTRCIEAMMRELLVIFARCADAGEVTSTGVSKDNPLALFFARNGDTLQNYLRLDDTVVWAAISSMRNAKEPTLKDLASRLLDRNLYKVLDCENEFDDPETRRRVIKRVREAAGNATPHSILEDKQPVSAYGAVKEDEEKAHKRLMIVDSSGTPKEITQRSPVVRAIEEKSFVRFAFKEKSVRDQFRPRRPS
jgi:hypothetical protein